MFQGQGIQLYVPKYLKLLHNIIIIIINFYEVKMAASADGTIIF